MRPKLLNSTPHKYSCFQNKRSWNKLWAGGQTCKQFRQLFIQRLVGTANKLPEVMQPLVKVTWVHQFKKKSWIMLWKRKKHYSAATNFFFFSLCFSLSTFFVEITHRLFHIVNKPKTLQLAHFLLSFSIICKKVSHAYRKVTTGCPLQGYIYIFTCWSKHSPFFWLKNAYQHFKKKSKPEKTDEGDKIKWDILTSAQMTR